MKEFEKKEILYENSIASRYNRDYHQSAIMKHYDEDFAKFVSGHYHKGDRVLDLGCGAASLWHLWKKYLPGHASIVGVDISEGMIEESRKLYPGGDFRAGSLFKIPAESGSFDIVIASSVLHHVPDEHIQEIFTEIGRVLDEHGTLVGREPLSSKRLGDEGGWFSGAIMAFRHLVFRLTRTREYPEPEIGEHHHAYDPSEFVKMLSKSFAPKGISLRFPFSAYVSRCDHPLVGKMAAMLDDSIGHAKGNIIHYAAEKNYYDAADIHRFIEQELKENEKPLSNKNEFMALLVKAAERIEAELGPDAGGEGAEKRGK